MEIPLEIAFHRLAHSDAAEREIRARVDKLAKIYDGLLGCRVRVDQRADPARTPPVVHIEMGIPGRKDLVVAYEPDRLQQRFQNPSLQNAISDAFEAAERQLTDLKRQREGGATPDGHDLHNQFRGQVAEMHNDEDHGFLMTKEGGLLYFHRNSLLSGDFDKLKRGDEVHYVEQVGDTGPIAWKIRPVSG